MRKIIFGSLFIAGLLWAQGSQPVEISQQDINLQNEISDANNKDTKVKTIKDFFKEFKNNYDIEFGDTQNGITFYSGSNLVSKGADDPDFSRALSIAYQRALLKVQAEYIKDNFGRQASQKLLDYERDESSNAREFEDLPKGGTLKQIWDKVTRLAGAKLDKALQDLGVSAEGLTEEQKKKIFQNKFMMDNLVKAAGSMKGLVTVQTFVAQNEDGAYEVGVIAVMSNKTVQIAEDMRLQRESLIKGKGGKPIKEYLPKNEKDFVNEYGTRLVYDENGSPMILSYGSWGFVPRSKDSIELSRQREHALKQATLQANAAIIEFINIAINTADTGNIGEELSTELTKTVNIQDGSDFIKEENFNNVLDKVKEYVKTKSEGNLRGIRTLEDWAYTAENGARHVGVVRYYSFRNVENANEIIGIQQSNAKGVSKDDSTEHIQNKAVERVERKSNMINSIDDF